MFNTPEALERLIEAERARIWAYISRKDNGPTPISEVIDDVLQEISSPDSAQRTPKPRMALRLTIDCPWDTAIELSALLWLVEVLVRLSCSADSKLKLELENVTSWIDYAVDYEPNRLPNLQAAARTLRLFGDATSGDGHKARRELLDYILSLA